MKKHLVWLLIVALCLNLAACNVQEEIPETDPTVPSSEAEQGESVKTSENEQVQDQEPPETSVPAQSEPEIELLEIDSKTFTEDLFNITGSLDLAYHADGVCYGPYTLMKYTHNMQANYWEKLIMTEEPDLSDCTSWLVLASGDGSAVVTVYETDPIYILYERDGLSRWYQKPEGIAMGLGLRMTFDSLEEDYLGRIRFYSNATGAELLEEYGRDIFPRYRQKFAPGSYYRYSKYIMISCELNPQNQENIITGSIIYAAIPDSGSIQGFAYMPTEGTGEYENLWIYEMRVCLEKHYDGMWHEVSARDIGSAVGEVTKWKAEDIEPNVEAKAFLKEIDSRLSQIREKDDGKQDILDLSELFLRCTTAIPKAGETDFDWTKFCTETSLSYVGMQALRNRFVEREHAKGFFDGKLQEEFSPLTVRVVGEEGWVILEGITIYFEKVNNQWMICDVSMPF